ncbi:endonuclease domain-containing 1 -like protein [Labeo rohita]|uniref:Endonuclease domain-containing 1-like protein n=1 Tax=Labeo rohita TaxID=84645 RepID=A0A498LHC3_LABRO|nr:endonuclease domain-containing 1 -like protein [Labeo rohita]
MFLLCLLTCFALSNFNVQAKVVKSFNECNQFFYKGKEPQGMNQNAKKICQKLQYDDFLYATLYSTFNKIPLYSAYKFDPKCSAEPDYMILEGADELKNKKEKIKNTQAISSDYEQTGFDRGHLYPNSFQCGEDRKDQLKGYRCYSGETQIQCSPQYSLITAEGNRCRDDHPCATYGKDYYWCFTDKESWQYCSPPLWGSRAKDGKYCRSDYACAKYNKTNPWCYTDDKNWSYCCTSDDYFSAVNYKTCKPDHPCGYHGKDYLWCHTTDGNWNYCCKEFKI